MTNNDIDLTLTLMSNGDISAYDYKKSIVVALTNLMMFETHDLPYNDPFTGNSLRSLLFDQPNVVTATFLTTNIEWLITQYEPRVELVSVVVIPLLEAYEINITYKIVRFNTIEKLTQVRRANEVN